MPLPKKAMIDVTFWKVSVLPNAVTRIVSPEDALPLTCADLYCSVMLVGSTFRAGRAAALGRVADVQPQHAAGLERRQVRRRRRRAHERERGQGERRDVEREAREPLDLLGRRRPSRRPTGPRTRCRTRQAISQPTPSKNSTIAAPIASRRRLEHPHDLLDDLEEEAGALDGDVEQRGRRRPSVAVIEPVAETPNSSTPRNLAETEPPIEAKNTFVVGFRLTRTVAVPLMLPMLSSPSLIPPVTVMSMSPVGVDRPVGGEA